MLFRISGYSTAHVDNGPSDFQNGYIFHQPEDWFCKTNGKW